MREKIKHHIGKVKENLQKSRLALAIALAVFASLMLTFVSLTIYKVGDYYRFDLSRPDYESERSNVVSSSTNVTYDTTSPLSKQDVSDAISELDEHISDINKYNTFGDDSLSDGDLQIQIQE